MARPQPVRADVIFGNGETFALSGAVARMILWLCRNRLLIEQRQTCEVRAWVSATGVPRFAVAELFDEVAGY